MEVELSSSLMIVHYSHYQLSSSRLTCSSTYSRSADSVATAITVATAGSRLSITIVRCEAFAAAACLLS